MDIGRYDETETVVLMFLAKYNGISIFCSGG